MIISALTLFSGFGLGTVLLPVFAIFFPVSVAVAATAIVHLANNLLRVILIGKKANWQITARFAIPSAFAAAAGAWLLARMSGIQPLLRYSIGDYIAEITVIKLIVAVLIAGFAVLEIVPASNKMGFSKKYAPIGGLISGFFGGLSGHQGALRSAFLVRYNLDKDAFVATAAVCSVVVDVTRLTVYGLSFLGKHISSVRGSNITMPVIVGCLSAFAGSFLAVKFLSKVTYHVIRLLIAIMLFAVSAAMAIGLI